MPSYPIQLFKTFRIAATLLFVVNLVTGATLTPRAKIETGLDRDRFVHSKALSTTPADAGAQAFQWNISDRESPLLGLANNQLKAGIDQSLSYPLDQLRFPIFQSLSYDDERAHFLLPSFSSESKGVHFIEFAPAEKKNTYTSVDGTNLKLTDNDSMKVVATPNGTRYIFVRYPDGEFRCATIRDANGTSLNLLYTANGLTLHGLVDSSGRTLTFNYSSDGIRSLTQTWMSDSTGLTKTWMVDDQSDSAANADVKYSHVVSSARTISPMLTKAVPSNALVRQYTTAMAESDRTLAHIFGGPDAVAGANGFEPPGLASSYPLYRGDILGDDGVERRGHLSYAMHLYGNADGTRLCPLYVPAGFTQHSDQPSPTDAVMTFYYPRLGNVTDVTLAVFHIADFQISNEGDRVRIGTIGGPGGSSASYKHSHIEFYRGNTGLLPLAERASHRIDPATIFTR
ncbi:MAG: hypothetical protein QOK48_1856 [Blastocatellia bacterium]|jgi:hypothetical protein|nr:hypothetical protein [Blastocatellia bacterium]